ncbi:hypothetical protein ACFQV2_02370 [Actinokineospora soli]|uniref:Uncharacterized protein n=1 Tax=Actinokineospora soli TaxID=1048753 RepID=A0ABW2THF8_9PSEU
MDERALTPANGTDPAAELVGQAGRVLGWLYRGGWEVARRLPGGDVVERQARKIEQAVVDEVRKRLDDEPSELQRVITAGRPRASRCGWRWRSCWSARSPTAATPRASTTSRW